MAYLNYTNPFDRVKKDWIQIDGKDTDSLRTEVKKVEDVGGVFSALSRGERNVDAAALQDELEKQGIKVSHDPAMTPNGISVSSAGILIALETPPTPREIQTIETAIAHVKANPPVRVAGVKGFSRSGRAGKGTVN
jgi:hypothetical protein